MSELEAQVCAILEAMVKATVSEMSEVLGGSDSTRPQASRSTTENTHDSLHDKVRSAGSRWSGLGLDRAGSGPVCAACCCFAPPGV